MTSAGARPARAVAGPREIFTCGPPAFMTAVRSGVSVECDAATTVLEAAASAGLRLRSSCQGGACGTCKSTLLSGAVDMQHAGGIRQREIDAGRFLPCCSRPLGDLDVDA